MKAIEAKHGIRKWDDTIFGHSMLGKLFNQKIETFQVKDLN